MSPIAAGHVVVDAAAASTRERRDERRDGGGFLIGLENESINSFEPY
jgi:hypothetical protein